jgi:hypothetical protein
MVALRPNPKLTLNAFSKFTPEMITVRSTPWALGENPIICGAFTQVKPASVVVPPCVFTNTAPLVAPTGTITVIDVGEFSVINASGPLPKITLTAPDRSVPKSVTVPPSVWESGRKPVNFGTTAAVSPVFPVEPVFASDPWFSLDAGHAIVTPPSVHHDFVEPPRRQFGRIRETAMAVQAMRGKMT